MTNRSVKDGIMLVGGFHYFLAALCFIGVAAVFVYSVLPPITENAADLAQSLFLPIFGMILGLILGGLYIYIGRGIIELKNTARIFSIFLGILGMFSGFIGLLSGIATNIIGQTQPDWVSILLTALALVCGFTIIAFINVFILIFLFNPKVRSLFYGEEVQDEEEATE